MPQLDFSTYPSQFFWLTVSFLLMLFLMSTFIVPKIRDIVNQRQRKIDDYLAAAARFKQQAEEAEHRYETLVAAANAKAAAALEKAQNDFRQKAAEQEKAASERLAQKTAESEQYIARLQQSAVTEVNAMAADLAMQIAAKMGWSELSEADVMAVLERGKDHD